MNMIETKKYAYSHTTFKAYELIKKMILSLDLSSGEKLDENRLCEELNMSRTPIREALSRLQQENFIVKVPRVGYSLRPFTLKEIKELYSVRSILEIAAVEMATPNLDEQKLIKLARTLKQSKKKIIGTPIDNWQIINYITEEGLFFHLALASYSHNETLCRFLNNVLERLTMLHKRLWDENRAKLSIKEHEELLEYLRRRDKNVHLILRGHIESARDYVMDMLIKNDEVLFKI